MKKRFFIYLTIACLLLTALIPGAYAAESTEPGETTEPVETTEETRAPDVCGEDLTWKLEGNTLTISGNGPMDDCTGGAPWAEYREKIHKVVLSGSVTSIGAEAFLDYDNLTEVDFGSSLIEIDTRAFSSCDGLSSITLPSTFRRFGEESFRGCRNLKEIHCLGNMPSFNLNCLWDSWVTIYFPVERPWPLVHIEQLETAFQGRIEFLASDGSDPYVPTEPTEVQPEDTKPQETQPETTQPTVTEPAETVPTTEAAETTATEETTAATEETTLAAEQTLETEEPSGSKGGTGIWIALVVCLLAAAGICVLLFFWRNSGGGKYSARR